MGKAIGLGVGLRGDGSRGYTVGLASLGQESQMPFEQVLPAVSQLSLGDQLRLIERIVAGLQQTAIGSTSVPYRSSWGALSHLGSTLSGDEIDAVRSEMRAGFGELEA